VSDSTSRSPTSGRIVDPVLPEVVFHRHLQHVVDLADSGAVAEVVGAVLAARERHEVRRLGAFELVDPLLGASDDVDGLLVAGEVLVEVRRDLVGVVRERLLVSFEPADVLVVEPDELLPPPDLLGVESDLRDQLAAVYPVVQGALAEVLAAVLSRGGHYVSRTQPGS